LQPGDIVGKKFEREVEINNKHSVKINLNEADLVELRSHGELKNPIEEENQWYSYAVKSPKRESGNIEKLILTQQEKVELSPVDIAHLKETGRLDHTLKVGEGVNERQYFIAVDKELNKLAFAPLSVLNSSLGFKNIKLSQENMVALLNGQKTQVSMPIAQRDNNGQNYESASIYFDPVRKNIRFEDPTGVAAKPKVVQKAVPSQALANVHKMTEQQAEAPVQTRKQQQGKAL
jgi:hypothetical protein